MTPKPMLTSSADQPYPHRLSMLYGMPVTCVRSHITQNKPPTLHSINNNDGQGDGRQGMSPLSFYYIFCSFAPPPPPWMTTMMTTTTTTTTTTSTTTTTTATITSSTMTMTMTSLTTTTTTTTPLANLHPPPPQVPMYHDNDNSIPPH